MSEKAKNNMPVFGKRVLGFMMSAVMAASAAVGIGAVPDTIIQAEAASTSYNLMDNVQEGVILHAWEWSFNNIKDNMKKIAESGYTAVQTSVIQQAKESTKGKSNSMWWMYYQPAQFKIDDTGNSALGTKAEFTEMCAEAHKYGIHVIVDVVANHLGNDGTKYTKSSAIPSDIRNDNSCWHSTWNKEIDYSSRYSITHGSMGGLPDLNTESSKIQTYVINYLKECIDCGADGFRFDAAKHISVPSEDDEYTFWPNVLNAANSYYEQKGTFDSLYCYGEILGGTGGPAITEYTKYLAITDNSTGNGIRNNINDKNASGAAAFSYNSGASPDKVVLWAESHDTYSNDEQETTNISTSVINKTWAMVGSRNKATALYYARSAGYRAGLIGAVGSTECFKTEVAEVNKFHNYFAGKSEYLSYSGNIAYNERGTSGVVLVNVSGTTADVSVTANKMADGTYKDQVSGNTFTVAGGKISGKIGSTGIAVVYNPDLIGGKVSVSPSATAFTTDTLTLTLKADAVENATYVTSEGASGSYVNGDKITIGSKTNVGKSIKVTVSAKRSDGSTVTAEYQYYKKDPNAEVKVYFDNSTYKWKTVYTYIYAVNSSNQLETIADWPGQQMTLDPETGYYVVTVPNNLISGYVMFTEAKSSENRYPGHDEPGLVLGGSTKLFGANYSWEDYIPPSNELVNTSTVSKEKVPAGTTFTVNCSATGGAGSYKYAIYYKKQSDTSWATKQNYSTNNKLDIKVGSATTFDLCVKAIDADGTVEKKYFVITGTVSASSDLSNTSSLSAFKVEKGKTLTVKCDSTGGSTGNVYTVLYKKTTDSSWATKQKYGTNKTVEMTFSKAVKYDICVKVKDTAGNVAKKYFVVTVNEPANALVNTSVLSSSTVKKGTAVTVKCSAKGGTAPYTYSVLYKKALDTKWAKIQDYNSNASVKVTPSKAVEYDVCIKVKDGSGKIEKVYRKLTVTA